MSGSELTVEPLVAPLPAAEEADAARAMARAARRVGQPGDLATVLAALDLLDCQRARLAPVHAAGYGDEDGDYCCRDGGCCGPGSWCCARAGDHAHDEAAASDISERLPAW